VNARREVPLSGVVAYLLLEHQRVVWARSVCGCANSDHLSGSPPVWERRVCRAASMSLWLGRVCDDLDLDHRTYILNAIIITHLWICTCKGVLTG
jgi:hypothetical protein